MSVNLDAPGEKGPQGSPGPQGNQWAPSTVPWPQGSQGAPWPQGSQGTAGGSMSRKWAWNSWTSYVINDWVSINGSSYICILANTNQTPPNGTYWQLVAQAGSQWAQGAQWNAWAQWATWSTGPQWSAWGTGPQGSQGAQWAQWAWWWWAITVTQTAHWFVLLNRLRYDEGTSTWVKAQSNTLNWLWMWHVVEVINVNSFKVAKEGTHPVANALSKWEYVLSKTTAWAYTQTIPSSVWDYVLYGMEVIDSTTVSFYPSVAKLIGSWLPSVWPDWFMTNGKIVTSVASNNLTVAIKTLAWNDPSAWDPVYCRIWGVIRTIDYPLSQTLNAWTNRYESWSSELATNEVDYFAYLWWTTVYNTVYLQPSRIPYAKTRADFSSTTTNEKYAPNAWDMNTTDNVVVVWRFNATLSAGAWYTRSIPATSVIINTPIYDTRRLQYAPTITRNWTAPTSLLGSRYRYKLVWDTCLISVAIDYNTAGTWNSIVTCTIPITEKAVFYTSWLNALMCVWTWSWYWVGNSSTCQMRWSRLVRIIWNSINANTFTMSWSYEIV